MDTHELLIRIQQSQEKAVQFAVKLEQFKKQIEKEKILSAPSKQH